MKFQVMVFAFIAMAVITAVYIGDELPLFDAVTNIPTIPTQCPIEGEDADGCVYDPDFVSVGGLNALQDLGHNISEFLLFFIDLIIEGLVFIGQIGGHIAIVFAFIVTTIAYPIVLFTSSAPWWLSALTVIPLSAFLVVKLIQLIYPGQGGNV